MKEDTGYSTPATGRQLHTIACLCQARGITDPVEEQPMTIGEAGILIRRLQGEKLIKTGNNTTNPKNRG